MITGLKNTEKPVYELNIVTGKIIRFRSCTEYSQFRKINPSSVNNRLNNDIIVDNHYMVSYDLNFKPKDLFCC